LAISLQRGQLDLKFQVEGVAPSSNQSGSLALQLQWR